MTKINASAQTVTCPGCGANINLTTAGKCSRCGTAYDLADYDWIHMDAPINITK